MSPAQNNSTTVSVNPSTSPKLKSSRYSTTTNTDFRIFEESLGLISSQSNNQNLDRNKYPSLAKRVKLSGNALSSGCTGVINKFRVTLPNIGFGYLDLRFSGPSRVILNHQYTKTGFLEVFYKVNEPGNYFLSIRYLGHEVPGSDFKITVKQQECNPKAVVASGKGLKKVKAGERATFNVDTRKAGSGKLVVSIQSPSAEDNEIKAYVDATKTGYSVEYHPLCIGYHSVTVKYNDVHIHGSPFKVKISAVTISPLLIEESDLYYDCDQLPCEWKEQYAYDSNNKDLEKKSRRRTSGLKLLRLPDLTDLRKTILLH